MLFWAGCSGSSWKPENMSTGWSTAESSTDGIQAAVLSWGVGAFGDQRGTPVTPSSGLPALDTNCTGTPCSVAGSRAGAGGSSNGPAGRRAMPKALAIPPPTWVEGRSVPDGGVVTSEPGASTSEAGTTTSAVMPPSMSSLARSLTRMLCRLASRATT